MSEDSKRGANDDPATDDPASDDRLATAEESAADDEQNELADGHEDSASHADDSEATTIDVKEKGASRAPIVLAVLAFLIALASAAGVGYLWSQQAADQTGRLGNELESLSSKLGATTTTLQRNEQALAELQSANSQASGALDNMTRTLDQRLGTLEAIPGRLSNLESSLSALQGISSGLRDTWLLAEAEYYLQIANAQLQLAANAELAGIALELADERLASLGNPALTDVRRQIANELRELEAMGDVDLEGAVLTLGSLANAIETLPLKNDIKVEAADDTLPDAEQTGMARAMASLKNAMSDVISVRRSDTAVKPLLPPDAAYFLRNNLTLQLQTARLAMLRGEQTVFEESLADAAAWIGEYYDPESQAVASALQTINELRGLQLTVSKPDISGSLTALRQFVSLRDERERAPAEPAQ
ncbi:MAG: hypothetical protein HKN35_03275 [Woeseia sp.]|nr:uroporphyrinogen-III C-methyltransferase [Woeseia sp.]MBT8096444.1 uroporphyrinogen-III C-methyltransferase [Woeseia sp.]NNE59891.1 hypothetical protein [Woeseia sp.]NNL53702.1 hypothetical protein [Woeseia sp.]